MMESHKQYTGIYRTHRDMVDDGSNAVMNSHREAAAAQLDLQGLPTTKVERYKYTDAEAAFAPDTGLTCAAWHQGPTLTPPSSAMCRT